MTEKQFELLMARLEEIEILLASINKMLSKAMRNEDAFSVRKE